MVLDGFETIISIYKNGSFIKNASCLIGKGWVVDLGPDDYTVVLSSKLSENKDLAPFYSAKDAYNVLVTCDGQVVGAGETVTIKFNGKIYTVYTDSKGNLK